MLLWATLAVLFTAGASKPEVCKESPTWNYNGQSVKDAAKGNVSLVALLTSSVPFCQKQAKRLEALLHEFASEGVNDLSFFIINLKSEEPTIDYLKMRVSFPVYQDNDNENIWKKLEGGNNDIYIYDKCGRLTYYIPFPFSIIHESKPIVSAALHSTYFDGLCGKSCDVNLENDAMLSDYNNSIYSSYQSVKASGNLTDIPNIKDVEKHIKGLNNSIEVVVEDMGNEFLNVLNNTNMTSNFNETELFNVTVEVKNMIKNHSSNSNETAVQDEMTVASVETNVTESPTYCQKEYQKTCTFWSKTKLKHAEKCCRRSGRLFEHSRLSSEEKPEILDCRHFGRKKCKKMIPLLKCCLSTVELNTVPPVIKSNETTTLSVQNVTNHSEKDGEDLLTTEVPPKKKGFFEKITK